jgi:hypothetical protein
MKDEGHQQWWPFFFAQKIMSCRTGALRAGDHFVVGDRLAWFSRWST